MGIISFRNLSVIYYYLSALSVSLFITLERVLRVLDPQAPILKNRTRLVGYGDNSCILMFSVCMFKADEYCTLNKVSSM